MSNVTLKAATFYVFNMYVWSPISNTTRECPGFRLEQTVCSSVIILLHTYIHQCL